jgi:hypothetical protein
MINSWRYGFFLGMSPLSTSSTAPRGGGKNGIEGHSPSHFQIISELPCVVDWNLVNRWVGPCSLLLDFGLGGWLLGHFSHVWSTVGHQCCWALGLWWITGVLDLVRGGLKK